MNAVYEALARSPLLREVQSAFRDATQLSFKLVPSAGPSPNHRGLQGNRFCALIKANDSACAACLAIQRQLARRFDRKLAPHQICCFAGITELAVPIIVGGQHIATLLGGQVFLEKPSQRNFQRVSRHLREAGMQKDLRKLKAAYFEVPVLSWGQFKGAVRLLALLAAQLGDYANRRLLTPTADEPLAVTRAKQFVNAAIGEAVSLRAVAEHVHLSRNHFCKVFKNAMGTTFTEYVSRLRVEKAKDLLANSQLRISEVVHRVGFNSISQFNRAFRRYARLSPSEYRSLLRRQRGLSVLA